MIPKNGDGHIVVDVAYELPPGRSVPKWCVDAGPIEISVGPEGTRMRFVHWCHAEKLTGEIERLRAQALCIEQDMDKAEACAARIPRTINGLREEALWAGDKEAVVFELRADALESALEELAEAIRPRRDLAIYLGRVADALEKAGQREDLLSGQ